MNYTLLKIPVLLSLLILSLTISAQSIINDGTTQITIQHFSTENGLSHNAVNGVFQDSRNLYWITTTFGLNRFDGQQFQLYTKEKNGIHSNILDIAYEDKDPQNDASKGMVWLLSGGTVSSVWFTENNASQYSIFDPYTEKAIDAKAYLGEELYKHLQHLSKYKRNKDHLLLTTETGYIIKYYHREKIEITKLKTYPNNLFFYKELSNRQYWLGHYAAEHTPIQFFSKNHQLQKTHKICLFDRHICENQANCRGALYPTITYEESDTLWLDPLEGSATAYGLHGLLPTGEFIDIPYHTLIPNFPKDKELNNIYYDAKNNHFWLTDASSKTYIVHPQKKLLYTLDFPLKYVCLKDKRGVFWAANTEGLYAIQFGKILFSKYFENTPIRGITVDNQNRIWAYPNRIEGLNAVSDNLNFRYKNILTSLSLLKDENETIWSFINQNNQWWLGRFEPTENGKVTLEPIETNNESVDIWSIYKDENAGLLWGGGLNGFLFNYNLETKQTTILNEFNGIDAFKKTTIYQILPYQENYFWLATSNGLYLTHKQKGIIARYWNEGKEDQLLPIEAIHHIHTQNENILWLGSRNSGLLKVQIIKNSGLFELKIIHHFTVDDGLPSNSIHAVYENPNEDGFLWLNTENGIAQFHKTAHFSTNFSKRNGIAHPEGNRIAHYQADDGRLYFGTINGITSFHPNDFSQQPNQQKTYIHIVGFEQFSQSTQQLESRIAQFQETQKIILPAEEGRVELKISQPFILGAQNVFYTYQIKGLNPKPIALLEPKLTISDVPFGDYTLTLKALNSKGELLEEQNIPLISKPPFYLQWWFLSGLIIVIGILIYFFYQYRTQTLLEQKANLEKEVRQRTQQLEADKIIIEQQAEELKQLDETKSRFFANVSHELRTPIQLIQGPIQSILKNNQLDNRSTTLLHKAKRNSNSLLKLVNEILDLTKLDANKLVLNEEAVVLYPFLRRVMSNFQSLADTKSIHFSFIYQPKETLQIDLDTDKFEKILNNLLTNALKFTPKGGRVEVEVSDTSKVSDTSFLEIKVKDNGRGIPEADLPHIFDRFYQSSTNTNPDSYREEGGLGIGLALSMEFVKLMNGKMWVESSTNESNQGSTFYFQFPKKEVLNIIENIEYSTISSRAEDRVISNDEYRSEGLRNFQSFVNLKDDQKQTILLVEDNHDMSDYIKFILSPYYNIITAENGKEALEWLTAKGRQQTEQFIKNPSSEERATVNRLPSAVVSDVMMPIMDGFEFLEKMKANEQWRLIPFIMLTARADMKDKIKALRIGVDDYLLKPFKEEELLVRIENLLNNAEERKAFSEVVKGTESIETEKSNLSTKDNEWLEKVEELVLKHLRDNRFSVDFLAELLKINRKTLYQKSKLFTGLTPNQYIRIIRLQYAKEQLEQGKYTSLKAAANDVGFVRPDYFSKLYVKEFGKSPMEYL